MEASSELVRYNTAGILVLILIFFHIPAILVLMGIPIYDSSANWLYYPRFYLLNPVYVSGFFVLEGITSDFKQPLSRQLSKDLLLIIVPCLVWGFIAEIIKNGNFSLEVFNDYVKSFFCYGPADFYILYMLFLTRLVYKISLVITNRKVRLFVLTLLSVAGLIVNNHSPIKYWEQLFILLPFIELGHLFKDRIKNRRTVYFLYAVYILGCIGIASLHKSLPMIHEGMSLNYGDWVLYLLMGFIGSLCFTGVCKTIKNKLVKYVGKNYVGYILIHITAIFIIVRLCYGIVLNGITSMWRTVVIIGIIYLLTLLICTGVMLLFNYMIAHLRSVHVK